MNPFAAIYKSCNSGDPAEKYADLPDFPSVIDIEPTGLCNFKCLMCPTGVNALGRPQGFMKWEVWKKVVDECEPHGTALRPYGWGEPTLHPRIVDMIACASDAGLMTHMNTNGSRLDQTLAERLIKAGLTSLKFSFQGVDRDSYAEMRGIDFFESLIDRIEMVRTIRGNRKKPWLAVSTSTTNEPEWMVRQFIARVAPLVDELHVGSTIFGFFDPSGARVSDEVKDKIISLAARERAGKQHPVPCPQVFDSLSIHWDGKAAVCCNAYGNVGTFGNVADTSVAELWRHQVIEAYRKRLAVKDYDAPLCRVCWDYMDLSVEKVA